MSGGSRPQCLGQDDRHVREECVTLGALWVLGNPFLDHSCVFPRKFKLEFGVVTWIISGQSVRKLFEAVLIVNRILKNECKIILMKL